jgi:hypothetical protein
MATNKFQDMAHAFNFDFDGSSMKQEKKASADILERVDSIQTKIAAALDESSSPNDELMIMAALKTYED